MANRIDPNRGLLAEFSFCDKKYYNSYTSGIWSQSVEKIGSQIFGQLIMVIDLPAGTESSQMQVQVKPRFISIVAAGKLVLEGELEKIVNAEATVWILEKNSLKIMLTDAEPFHMERQWTRLLKHGRLPLPFVMTVMGDMLRSQYTSLLS